MRDLTLVIAHRGNCMGLWMTVHSAIDNMQKSGIDYDIAICSNGGPVDNDLKLLVGSLEKMGRLAGHVHSDSPLSPPVARQRAAAIADGRILCFSDNHCLFQPDFFRRFMADLEVPGIDVIHASVIFYAGERVFYDYNLTLARDFWANYRVLPKISYKPYPTAAAGHGVFAVRRSVWEEVGGYCPEGVLIGYGGEELMFNLKVWLLGKQTHMDPKSIHYHYPGTRGYSGRHTDEFYTNMLACANVIGGEDWMYKVYASFAAPGTLRAYSKYTMYDLLQIAEGRSRDYAKELASKRVRTLDELLTYFKSNDISM